MGNTLQHSAEQTQQRAAGTLDWRKKISDHVAYGLLVYTGLHIVIISLAKTDHSSMLPYLALVVLVVAIIPGCRLFESRWSDLSDAEAANPALSGKFAKDRLAIWLLAIGLPFALTGFFKGLAITFG